MAGKGLALTTRRLGYALDALSKNALIDLVVDRARAEIGEDSTEEAVAEMIQAWLGPVLRERDDRPVSLRGLMARLDKNDEDYRNKTGKYTPVEPPKSSISPEKMEEAFREQRSKPYR